MSAENISRQQELLSSSSSLEAFETQRSDISTNANPESQGLIDALAATRYNGVKVGPYGLLFSSLTYCEFIVAPKYSKVPNAPSRLKGLINLRGNLFPLYQVHEYLERFSSEERNAATRLADMNKVLENANALLVGQVPRAAALLIEGKPSMFSRADAKPVKNIPLIPEFLAPSVINILEVDGGVWFEVDPNDFFCRLSAPGFPDVAN